jgi:hypothetical protein
MKKQSLNNFDMKFREIDRKRFDYSNKLEEQKNTKKHLMKRYQELNQTKNDTITKR